jgi:hypothetical protein
METWIVEEPDTLWYLESRRGFEHPSTTPRDTATEGPPNRRIFFRDFDA